MSHMVIYDIFNASFAYFRSTEHNDRVHCAFKFSFQSRPFKIFSSQNKIFTAIILLLTHPQAQINTVRPGTQLILTLKLCQPLTLLVDYRGRRSWLWRRLGFLWKTASVRTFESMAPYVIALLLHTPPRQQEVILSPTYLCDIWVSNASLHNLFL